MQLIDSEPAVAPSFEAVRLEVEDAWRRQAADALREAGVPSAAGAVRGGDAPGGAVMSRLAILLGLMLALAGPAVPHALQPGFLDLKALGGDAWRIYWKVPTDGAGRHGDLGGAAGELRAAAGRRVAV